MAIQVKVADEQLPSGKALWLIALLGLGFAAWCVLTTLLPYDRYIQYQQLTDGDLFRSLWVYERIHYDKTPIDVAIIGTSRVEAAISPVILEQKLTAKLGRPINLAIPDEGRNLHYLFARELLENHPETRMILLSVNEQADVTHPGFRYLGSAEDLLRAPLFLNHYYFLDAAILPYRQMSYFVQSQFPGWFGVSHTLRSDYLGATFDPTFSFTLPSGRVVDRYMVGDPAKLEALSKERTQMLGGTWHPASRWHQLNNPIEPEYTKRLAKLAAEHCAEVVFVHLPYYKIPEHIYDEGFYQRLGPLLDARELSTDPHLYADLEHYNRYGTEQVAKWLGDALTPHLGPLESAACPAK
jgi:hypothetical protein